MEYIDVAFYAPSNVVPETDINLTHMLIATNPLRKVATGATGYALRGDHISAAVIPGGTRTAIFAISCMSQRVWETPTIGV